MSWLALQVGLLENLHRALSEFLDLRFHSSLFVGGFILAPIDIMLVRERIEEIVGLFRGVPSLLCTEDQVDPIVNVLTHVFAFHCKLHLRLEIVDIL